MSGLAGVLPDDVDDVHHSPCRGITITSNDAADILHQHGQLLGSAAFAPEHGLRKAGTVLTELALDTSWGLRELREAKCNFTSKSFDLKIGKGMTDASPSAGYGT